MKIGITFLAIVSSLLILFIFLFLGYFSYPLLKTGGFWALILDIWNPPQSFGLSSMVIGTFYIASLATILAFIFSIFTTLTVISLKHGFIKKYITSFFNLLASIPTVVYGFLGVILLVPYMRSFLGGSGMSILSASIVLSFVITPTMVLFFYNSFISVNKEYECIVKSLGGDNEDYQMMVLLPYRFKSIVVGLVMGFARAIGDTMIALMVAGNSISMPNSIFDTARTLSAHIALQFGGDFDSMEFKSIFASGLFLFLLSFVLLFIVKVLSYDKKTLLSK